MIDIPDVVRDQAVAVGADDWLANLSDIVAELATSWNITVGTTFPDATEAYVAEALRDDGELLVLKIHIPREGVFAQSEITTLKLANGDGCVLLVDYDVALGALLLERLGPSLHDLALPIDRRHEILCGVAERMWRPAPDCALPNGRQKATAQMESIRTLWEELDHPCSERVVEYALECGERRSAAHDDESAVLVHGDIHQWNTLQAKDRFKLVDPDGGVAEAEFDLGVLMREDPVELIQGDPKDRARFLSARCDLDVEAIWEWGSVQRVWNGLLCFKDDLQPFGRQMLEAAEACVE
jgi:streptomycin 6-kinase